MARRSKKNDVGCAGAFAYLILGIIGLGVAVILLAVAAGAYAVLGAIALGFIALRLIFEMIRRAYQIAGNAYGGRIMERVESVFRLHKKYDDPPAPIVEPVQPIAAKEKERKYSTMTRSELDQFAIMCNAAIEHEEEMEQYKEFFEKEESI